MSPNASEAEKVAKEPAPAQDAADTGGAATDEEVLRLRSRLEREFAVVGQKLADAEEAIIDIEVSLRTYETGTRPRLAPASRPADQSSDRPTARLKIGEGFSKIKEWVSKPKEGEGAETAPGSRQGSGIRMPARPGGDLEDRLDDALRSVAAEIKERERHAADLDRKLHDGQRELIKQRAQEQHARETQIKLSQAKQLSEDYERKMAAINEMVRSFESGGKGDPSKPKPKEAMPSGPNFDDRLQSAVDEALKAVAAQEKKVADLEKEVERANASLVEERALQQRVRAMQIRLRQARYFSTDLQRSLDSLGGALDELRHRAAGLLKPKPGRPVESPPKPSGA
jgi:hypothetical protein